MHWRLSNVFIYVEGFFSSLFFVLWLASHGPIVDDPKLRVFGFLLKPNNGEQMEDYRALNQSV